MLLLTLQKGRKLSDRKIDRRPRRESDKLRFTDKRYRALANNNNTRTIIRRVLQNPAFTDLPSISSKRVKFELLSPRLDFADGGRLVPQRQEKEMI